MRRVLLWAMLVVACPAALLLAVATVILLVSGELVAALVFAVFTAIPCIAVRYAAGALNGSASGSQQTPELVAARPFRPEGPASSRGRSSMPLLPLLGAPGAQDGSAEMPNDRLLSDPSLRPVPAAPSVPAPPNPSRTRDAVSASSVLRRWAEPAVSAAPRTAANSRQIPFMQRFTGVRRVNLTRLGSGRAATAGTFVALDLETTGLNPKRDRVIEVGAVRFTGDGQLLDEFSTLIAGPPSSLQAIDVHQIEDSDRVDAPAPPGVWAELMQFLAGSVMVCHNLEFDQAFLLAESRRHDVAVPDLPAVCTLVDARRHFDAKAFSLKSLHRHASGAWRDDTHQALGDARATMEVLLWMIHTSPQPMRISGRPPLPLLDEPQQTCIIRCRPAPLLKASVAGVLAALPQSPHPRTGDAAELERYLTLLDDVLDDGRLTYTEARELAAQAVRTGLTGTQLLSVHERVFAETFPEASEADVPGSRLMQMAATADGLGLESLAGQLRGRVPEPESQVSKPPLLRGRRYGFIGDSDALVEVRERALACGAPQVKNITKTVRWVAVDDPEGQTRHHAAARKLDLPIVSADEASMLLAEDIEAAERKRAQREELMAVREVQAEQRRQDKAAREAERNEYWRPKWRRRERKADPGPRR